MAKGDYEFVSWGIDIEMLNEAKDNSMISLPF